MCCKVCILARQAVYCEQASLLCVLQTACLCRFVLDVFSSIAHRQHTLLLNHVWPSNMHPEAAGTLTVLSSPAVISSLPSAEKLTQRTVPV